MSSAKIIEEKSHKELSEVIFEQSVVRNIGFYQSTKRPSANKNLYHDDNGELLESNIVIDSDENETNPFFDSIKEDILRRMYNSAKQQSVQIQGGNRFINESVSTKRA